MGDQPYLAPLPWVVFAVIARTHGDGTSWASLGALIVAATLLLTSRQRDLGIHNTLQYSALTFFFGLGLAGFVWNDPNGWLAQNARTVSALGYTAIALLSLRGTPITDFYFRPNVRPRYWNTKLYRQFTHSSTLLWAKTFAAIAVSHFIATKLHTPSGYTLFNWVTPIAIAMVAIHRSQLAYERFDEACELSPGNGRNYFGSDLGID